jgi:hypothetical protein
VLSAEFSYIHAINMIVVPLKIKLISSLAVGTLIFVINLLWMPSTLMRTEELIMPKMVVFSSDDWGRWTDVIPLWPNLEYQEEFIRNGGSFPPKLMNWIYGTVETEQDIKKFFDLINDLNKDVRFEHRATMEYQPLVAATHKSTGAIIGASIGALVGAFVLAVVVTADASSSTLYAPVVSQSDFFSTWHRHTINTDHEIT